MSRKFNSFCILPWVSISNSPNGYIRLCCGSKASSLRYGQSRISEIWNSDYYKNIRKKMLLNEQIDECSACYHEEKKGLESRRLIKNRQWKEKLCFDSFVSYSKNNSGEVKHNILDLDLKLGNNCNLKCRMCSPNSSSSIFDEGIISESRNYSSEVDFSYDYLDQQSFWDDLNLLIPSLESLYMTGGEPLLNSYLPLFLENCIEVNKAKEIDYKFFTNLTVPISKKSFELLAKFKTTTFGCSIDGYKQINDYIRYPSTWKKVMVTFDSIVAQLKKNQFIMLNVTVSWYNILNLVEYLNWVRPYLKENKNINVFFTMLHSPSFLCIKNLPLQIKLSAAERLDDFISGLEDSEYVLFKEKEILKMINQVVLFMDIKIDGEKHFSTKFNEECVKLDNRRSQKLSEFIPDLYSTIFKDY